MRRLGSPVIAPVASSVATQNLPPRVVTLKPSHWAETWLARPREDAPVGLRLPSEKVIADAIRRSTDAVVGMYQAASETPLIDAVYEAYNSELMVNVLAHALCVADNVALAYFETAPNTKVQLAFRSETIRMLWEELTSLRESMNPTVRLATDEEVSAIGVAPERATPRLRRLLALVHDELDRIEG